LREYGADLMRIKGIVRLVGDEKMWLVQGVHAAIESRRSEWDSSGDIQGRCVFIGRDLSKEMLEKGLSACVYLG
jgi:G3E family GTPase